MKSKILILLSSALLSTSVFADNIPNLQILVSSDAATVNKVYLDVDNVYCSNINDCDKNGQHDHTIPLITSNEMHVDVSRQSPKNGLALQHTWLGVRYPYNAPTPIICEPYDNNGNVKNTTTYLAVKVTTINNVPSCVITKAK